MAQEKTQDIDLGITRFEYGEHDRPLTRDVPHKTRLLSVEVRRKKHERRGPENWLYWTWEKRPNYLNDCGYSGFVMDGEREQQYYLLIEEQPEDLAACYERNIARVILGGN